MKSKKESPKKRTRLVLFLLLTAVAIVPITRQAIGSVPFHSFRMPASFKAPQPEPSSAPAIRQTPQAPVSLPSVRIQTTAEGATVRERFDSEGRRLTKELFMPGSGEKERWIFDPPKERIIRYEKYQGKEYRIAKWSYQKDLSFVKTNKIFNFKKEFLRSFLEYSNAEGIKYREEWYDSQGRLLSRKLWHEESGDFASHLYISYLDKGFSRRTFLDSKGNKIEEKIYGPEGRPVKAGFIGLGSGRKRDVSEFPEG